MGEIEVGDQKIGIQYQGLVIGFDGLVIVVLAEILVGKVVQVRLMPGGIFDRLLIHRYGLISLLQLVMHHAQSEISVCQCRVARDRLCVKFLRVFVRIDSCMQITPNEICVGIVGALFQDAVDALFNHDGMELAVRRIEDAGLLQPEPGGARVEPSLRQRLLIGLLGMLELTGRQEAAAIGQRPCDRCSMLGISIPALTGRSQERVCAE